MAHHESAKKRIRRNDRAKVRNRQYLSSVKTAVKKFRAAVVGVAEGSFDKAKVAPLFVNAQSLLAKAASKGVLHKNNVTRKIGRLSKLLSAVETGNAKTAVAVPKKKSGKAKTTAAKATKTTATTAKAAPKAVAKKTPAKKSKK